MAYTKVNWQDLPSTSTPRNATNLGHMDDGIKTNDDSITTLNSVAFKEQSYLQQDFNNYTTAGSYMINTTNLSNIPISAPGVLMVWVGHYSDYNTIYLGQLYISNVDIYTRFRDTGSTSWTIWKKLNNSFDYKTMTSTNINDIKKTGTYTYDNGSQGYTNAPTNDGIHILSVTNNGGEDWLIQEDYVLRYGAGFTEKYIRQYSPGGWSGWQKII